MLLLDEPFLYQWVEYRTVENFYQAMKLPRDRVDLRAEIAAMSPFESKKAIRDKSKYPWREDWTKEESIKVMDYALRKKFTRTSSWGRKLLETTDEIVETNNWHDNFWGNCICDKCKDKVGENHLGLLLTSLREELKS
jgi:hypothetical protein